MKTITSFALLFAAAATAASAAVTNPVGFVSQGDTTVGVDNIPASSDASLSLPLAQPAAFTGAADSATATTVTVQGAPGWTATTEWTTEPHLLVVTSGAEEGATALITDNTADTVTATSVVGDLSAVANGDSVRIEPATTLLSMLPIGVAPNGTNVILFDEGAGGINLGAAFIYTMTPSGWLQTFGGPIGPADDVVVYPGEAFLVRTPASAGIADLVFTGEVPTWNHRTIISKNSGASQADNRVGYFSPVEEEIGAAGIPAGAGDNLIVFDNTTSGVNKGASQILTYTGTAWLLTFGGPVGPADDFPIGGGKGYIYRRAAGNPDGDLDWSNEQGYIPSL